MEWLSTQMGILAVAFFLDWAFGDPRFLYHPVRAIGFLATKFESVCRRVFGEYLKLAGTVFLVMQLVFWYVAISGLHLFLSDTLPFLGMVFLVYITYSMLAFGSLFTEVKKVKNFLEEGKIEEAREVAQGMVSRDLSEATGKEIIRATIESATENISDGIIAPIFYFFIGGPVLMFLYKVVNTLDSMVGYKNEKYFHFGWASARFDDLLNLIPARITGLLIILVAGILGDSSKGASVVWMRDGQKGPSPNGGIPITAFAGARNIKLGGPCKVGDKTINIPFVGGEKENFGIEEIGAVLSYVSLSSLLMFTCVFGILFFIHL